MKYINLLFISSLLTLNASAYPEYNQFNSHRSIFYVADLKDKRVENFINELNQNKCLLDERDIKFMVVTRNGFQLPNNLFNQQQIKDMLKSYNLEESNHVGILIGKDGKEKHRWSGEPDWSSLMLLVDDMPLRKAEMEKKKSRCVI
ncbi:hypothetical protein SKA34_14080 [Photobacterium sp. SKA34]|uniref:DUF4174 domain-containing protein n=1 Tax=Photobacterium sp. SKA34 TaxID=121723 RepID=UPI00006B9A07|nr:DUF4174 domain-containing protein [Photobacterium sp. SKA34]EAR53367.1 hypothetical protein SKA34_14080 [Photobacterium sp. SKA34]